MNDSWLANSKFLNDFSYQADLAANASFNKKDLCILKGIFSDNLISKSQNPNENRKFSSGNVNQLGNRQDIDISMAVTSNTSIHSSLTFMNDISEPTKMYDDNQGNIANVKPCYFQNKAPEFMNDKFSQKLSSTPQAQFHPQRSISEKGNLKPLSEVMPFAFEKIEGKY
jgi:hypothetical protein